jgi:hypothetical protein
MVVPWVSQAIFPVAAHHEFTTGTHPVNDLWTAWSPALEISEAKDSGNTPVHDVLKDRFKRAQVAVNIGDERDAFQSGDPVTAARRTSGSRPC